MQGGYLQLTSRYRVPGSAWYENPYISVVRTTRPFGHSMRERPYGRNILIDVNPEDGSRGVWTSLHIVDDPMVTTRGRVMVTFTSEAGKTYPKVEETYFVPKRPKQK